MSYLRLVEADAADIPTPPLGRVSLFLNSATGQPSYKDDAGVVHAFIAGDAGAAGGDLAGFFPNPTLAASGVAAATYGDASHVAAVALDAKGRATGASNIAIAIAESAVTNLVTDLAAKAPLASPALTGNPTAPTASPGDNDTSIATTAFVAAAVAASVTGVSSVFGRTGAVVKASGDYLVADVTGAAPLASPTFTGAPAAPTPSAADNSTKIATTAYVDTADALKANLASPTFTGTPAAPTASAATSTTQLATTAFVTTADNLKANLASPTLTGTPLAPTASAATNNTQIATTAYADNAVAKQLEAFTVAVGDETTAITTGTAKVTFRMPFAMTLSSVRASLTTASSSGIPTVNIKESGTTIFSTKLTIDATELTSQTAATAAVLSDTSLADDAQMTIDIDVAGTGAAGLKVTFLGTRT